MNNMRIRWVALSVTMLAVLTACGGGGGSAGTSPFGNGSGNGTGTTSGTGSTGSSSATSNTLVAAAELVDSSGTATSSVATAGSRVKVTTKVNGVAQAGALVTVTATSGTSKIVMNPADGSALTDASGIAYVQIAPASLNDAGAFSLGITAASNGVTATTTLSGSITAGSVSLGTLATGVPNGDRLAAFGTTELSVPVIGASAASTVKVSFSSTCVSSGKASLSPMTATVDADGKAKTTYKDLGCATSPTATDAVSASVDGASSATAGATILLSQPQATNIEFVAASPSTIYLAGSGGVTSSKVTFKVVNQSGVGIPGIRVDLTPDTNAGGLTLNSQSVFPVPVTSDANGLVDATVLSGTVPTPVRIAATYTYTDANTSTLVSLKSVSSALSINSGLPSQKFMSTALSKFNIDGMNLDGETTDVTVRLADRSGNPVPDGTTVNFRTESGQIVGSCQTVRVNGLSMCTGHLESQDPRPPNGYVSLVAYALGEETFVDENGDNVFTPNERYDDLGDVFLDADESATWNGGEDFVAFGTHGNVACAAPWSANAFSKINTCDGGWGKAHVRSNVRFILSTTASAPRLNELPASPAPADPSSLTSVAIGCDQVTNRTYLLRDANTLRNNPWPSGSTVTVEGTNVSVKVFESKVANTLYPTIHNLEFSARACENGAPKGSARVTFKVTNQSGTVTWGIPIPVQ